jgi:hypothetical protein
MRKFETLERRDAPAGVVVIRPPQAPIVTRPDPGGDPPYGRWFDDDIVLFDGSSNVPSSGGWDADLVNRLNETSGSGGQNQTVPAGNSQAIDQVYANYSERDLNTDGRVDLTDFAFMKATLHGQAING